MGFNSMEVRRVNRNDVLRYMLSNKRVSKKDISVALNLSRPTVLQCIKELQELGLVEEEGVMDSVGGRRSMAFCVNADAKMAVGVDITRNHANIVITNLAMEVKYFVREKIKIVDKEASYNQLHTLIEEAISASGIDEAHIIGLGIAIPAIVNENKTGFYSMHEQMNLDHDLQKIVQKWFSFPVIMENDADCAARAELLCNGEKDNRLFFFVSPSVGGSVYIDGKILYGRNRRAGEFGHMILIPGGEKCYCGRIGCVSCYCSTECLSDLTDGDLGKFFEHLKDGDAKYVSAWDKYLDYLALAVHNLMTSFDMKMIIGGYLGQYLGDYMDDLKKRVCRYDSYLEGEDFVRPAVLKYEASALGAAVAFMEEYISEV